MPNRQISRLRMLGLLFCLGGGALITLGWMGTARHAHVDQQMPYLISGGAAGLGLIIIGVGLLLIAQLRAEVATLTKRLAELTQPDSVDESPITTPHTLTRDTERIPLARAGEPGRDSA